MIKTGEVIDMPKYAYEYCKEMFKTSLGKCVMVTGEKSLELAVERADQKTQ